MKAGCIIAYVAIAVAFCSWMDAMDNRYELAPESSRSALSALATSAIWPISLPMAMAAIAIGGQMRWRVAPPSPQLSSNK